MVRVQGEESSLSNAEFASQGWGIFWSLERKDWLGALRHTKGPPLPVWGLRHTKGPPPCLSAVGSGV